MTELGRLGWRVTHLAWPSSFPFPDAADLAAAERSLAACPDGSRVMIDGLAFGALPELAEKEGSRLCLVALVHHPLAHETGLIEDDRARLFDSERRALAAARAIIVTSGTTATTLAAEFGVPPDRITVARPGCDAVSPAIGGRAGNDSPRLLSIGTVTPRKGHDILVEALARIADLPWTLTIAGSLDRAPAIAAALVRQIEDYRLGDRIRLVGEIEGTAALYRSADIFVLASRYEGYGMVFAEALRHGLPVVGTLAGAIPEIVPATAGILVPAGDAPALGAALRDLIVNPTRLAVLAGGARAAGASLPSWEEPANWISSMLLGL